ncbi:putative Transmembrane protein [Quillaja saponaria]|uniref:Transmembrane protein n=1 Tax=Quillaja saponaria TaxID=32244 RepID=A0AAD7VME5_QUISA|nr:putative Transmembrane protein [Quillaja saponaria]
MSTSIAFSIFFLLSLTLLNIATAQDRAPHGLVYENPAAFPPSAYDFFHPNTQQPQIQDSCHASKCSTMPLAAQVEATQAYENKALASPNDVGSLAGNIWELVELLALSLVLHLLWF